MIPLTTLDPAAPLDDLEWLDLAIGDARVVAIGESAHYNREFYELRHRLLRYLVERHGFSAYATESGFVEGRLPDTWVRGGEERLGHVMANGMTSLMGLWKQMRAHLEWMRRHNRTAAHPVGFHGIDMPGSMVSLLPGLDAVTAYLAQADPGFQVDPAIRETAAALRGGSVGVLPPGQLPAGEPTEPPEGGAVSGCRIDLESGIGLREVGGHRVQAGQQGPMEPGMSIRGSRRGARRCGCAAASNTQVGAHLLHTAPISDVMPFAMTMPSRSSPPLTQVSGRRLDEARLGRVGAEACRSTR
ncbi:hypothetical protein GCM10020219_052860 [Nonomuraea dietziae]